MSARKQRSGGQAIVMVTLALFAIAGMMGLAVDLGWSFFVQKQAQASADGAALAAVHEAWVVLGGTTAFSGCPTNTVNGIGIDCIPVTSCTGVSNAKNTYNGCLYARSNGFNWDSDPKHQTVTIQANVGPPPYGGANPPTVSNVNNIAYWVTVRATQSIPQLFSAILGNTNGTVSAIATAAVVAQTIPASFYGMNRVGDCMAFGGGLLSSAGLKDCGVDIDVGGAGKSDPDCPVGNVILCGPNGIMLSSACNGGTAASFSGCVDPNSKSKSQNYAGQNSGPGLVESGAQIQIFGQGNVDRTKDSNGFFDPNPVSGASSSSVGDPFNGKTQPPIIASKADGCQLSTPVLTGGGKSLGPYQYYVATPNGTSGFIYGAPITIGTTETFASNGICPGQIIPAGGPATGTFAGYVFYGGLQVTTGANVTFGNGQYVFAGNSSSAAVTGGPTCPSCAFAVTGATVSCSSCMLLTTDGVYDTAVGGLTQPAPLATSGTTFYQAPVQLKNSTMNLTGTSPGDAAGTLANFDNILFWQDRRNSTATYNSDATNITPVLDPNSGTPSLPPVGNHVTNGSPEFQADDGNAGSKLTGVIHQPIGAWFNYQPGTASSSSSLQIFTGAFTCRNSGNGNITCGSSRMNLLPLTAPVVVFKTALIQ